MPPAVRENYDILYKQKKALTVTAKAFFIVAVFYWEIFSWWTQSVISPSEARDENRLPSVQFPESAASAKSLSLFPMPELDEVQNGITVFPEKSFALMNVLIGQAAMPHQIG